MQVHAIETKGNGIALQFEHPTIAGTTVGGWMNRADKIPVVRPAPSPKAFVGANAVASRQLLSVRHDIFLFRSSALVFRYHLSHATFCHIETSKCISGTDNDDLSHEDAVCLETLSRDRRGRAKIH